MVSSENVPVEAGEALRIVRDIFGPSVVAVYLFGSAVRDGLRPRSDVDLLAVVDRTLSREARRRLIEALMRVSGRVGDDSGRRPVELTVLRRSDVVPWRYPPRRQLVYGEWLREEFESGGLPGPAADPDLAIVLAEVRDRGVPLVGPPATTTLDPVPDADLRRAIRDTLPGVLAGMRGDERNVLLTLARMWLTAAEDRIAPKDVAAEWAIARLPGEGASLLELARSGYLGEREDVWAGKEAATDALAGTMRRAIEACLAARP